MYSSLIAPVCTTELGLVAALQDEFDSRNVKVIGLSANDLDAHEKWIADINEVNNVELNFPIIADPKREVSALYDMLDYQVRSSGLDNNNLGEMQFLNIAGAVCDYRISPTLTPRVFLSPSVPSSSLIPRRPSVLF